MVYWAVVMVVNYWIFARNERWKTMVSAYDAQPISYINKHTTILIGLLVFSWVLLVALWHTSYVPH